MLPVFEDLLLDKSLLGQILRAARESVGMTVRGLAVAAGLTNSHISKIELGQIQVSADTLARVFTALCLPPGLILESCFLVSRGIYEPSAFNDPHVLQMAERARGGNALRKQITDFVVGTALATSYLLKSSAPRNLVERIPFAVESQKSYFVKFVEKNLAGFDPVDRNTLLVNLVTECYQTLTDLELVQREHIEAYLALCRSKNPAVRLPWIPMPAPPFFADEIPMRDPQQMDIGIIFSNLKRDKRRLAAQQSGLATTSKFPRSKDILDTKAAAGIVTGMSLEVPSWLQLKKDIARFTAERGQKAALAAELGVSRQVLGNWLSSDDQGAPNAELTLRLFKWVLDRKRKGK